MRRKRGRTLLARLCCAGLAAVTSLVFAATSVAAEPLPSPLRPGDVLAYAHTHRDEITAARARAASAAEKPKVVSALPDPMIMLSLDHLPFSLMGVNASFQVQQDFPLSGILGDRQRSAEAESLAASADATRVALDVEYQALRAYLGLVERRRVTTILDEQLTISKQALAAAKARAGSGADGSQAEVVRAQVDVVRLEGEREAIDAEVEGATARLNVALARPAEASVPREDLALPAADPPTPASLTVIALEKRPELAVRRAIVEKAEADVQVMRAMYYPMAFVRAGPSYMMTGGYGVKIMVGVSVPLWREKLGAGVSGAKAMVVAAHRDVAAEEKQIEGDVADARAAVSAAKIRWSTTKEKVTPLARLAVSLALDEYASGKGRLVSALDALQTLRAVRLEEAVDEVKLALALARLGRATGVLRGGSP